MNLGAQRNGPTLTTRSASPRVARAPLRLVPSGNASSGSSSSSGTSTNRRVVTSRCGSVSRSLLELDVVDQQQVDVERARRVAWAAEVAPALGLDRACRGRAAPRGSSSVRDPRPPR